MSEEEIIGIIRKSPEFYTMLKYLAVDGVFSHTADILGVAVESSGYAEERKEKLPELLKNSYFIKDFMQGMVNFGIVNGDMYKGAVKDRIIKMVSIYFEENGV